MAKPNPPKTRFFKKNRSENKKSGIGEESWFTHIWRPAMAWSYMAICLFDFIIAPTGTAILITFYKSTIPVWKSLTLENGGIIHVAFGAILGVAAWGRTREAVVNSETGYGYDRGSVYTRDDVYVGRGPSRGHGNDRDCDDRDRNRGRGDRDRDRDRDSSDDELTDNMHEADKEDRKRN